MGHRLQQPERIRRHCPSKWNKRQMHHSTIATATGTRVAVASTRHFPKQTSSIFFHRKSKTTEVISFSSPRKGTDANVKQLNDFLLCLFVCLSDLRPWKIKRRNYDWKLKLSNRERKTFWITLISFACMLISSNEVRNTRIWSIQKWKRIFQI